MSVLVRGKLVELYLKENNLTIRLTGQFMDMMESWRQSATQWQTLYASHPDELARNPPNLHRFLFACCALPDLFYTDPTFVIRLLDEGSGFLNYIWQTIGKALEEGERLTDDAVGYTTFRPSEGCAIFCIDFPLTNQEHEVRYAAIAAWQGSKRFLLPPKNQCAFFTVETGLNREQSEKSDWNFWAWEDREPRAGTLCPPMDKQAFVNRIVEGLGLREEQ